MSIRNMDMRIVRASVVINTQILTIKSIQMRNKNQHQKGLTLIELLLVMTILIGLAGVLVPVFSNVIGQTHASSSSANIEGVVRQMENHRATFGLYPNDADLLLDDAATEAIVPFGGTVAATELTTAAITDRIGDALNDAGITNVIRHPETPPAEENQTVFTGTAEAVDAGAATPTPANFVVLGADAITRLGLEAIGTDVEQYVVLGLGNNSAAVGRSMAASPVHYLPDGGSNEDIYSRFLMVYRIPAGEGSASIATVATVDVHDGDGEVVGLDNHITEWHHSRE